MLTLEPSGTLTCTAVVPLTTALLAGVRIAALRGVPDCWQALSTAVSRLRPMKVNGRDGDGNGVLGMGGSLAGGMRSWLCLLVGDKNKLKCI